MNPLPVVSVTLVGPRDAGILGKMLGTLPGVTRRVVVWTGPDGASRDSEPGQTLASQLADYSTPLAYTKVVSKPWTGDFGEMRQYALEAAHAEFGPCWVLYADSDMSFTGSVPELDDTLDAYRLTHGSGTYQRELLVRSNSGATWYGRTHESLRAARVGTLEGLTWNEPEKTPEELQSKYERDAKDLLHQIADEPEDPRWLFYLAETYYGQGLLQDAIDRYKDVIGMEGWPEQRAWSAFRAADCYMKLEDWRNAARVATSGIFHFPQMPELYYVAACAAHNGGRPGDAKTYSLMAMLVANSPENLARIGFRYRFAWKEGPLQVLSEIDAPT